jgi:hypothetical protein
VYTERGLGALEVRVGSGRVAAMAAASIPGLKLGHSADEQSLLKELQAAVSDPMSSWHVVCIMLCV